MRNLTVREVANALGLTKRAVIYRLEKGQLKGTRVSNSSGVEEWRVYPNKEITQAIGGKNLSDIAEPNVDFEPETTEIFDVEDVAEGMNAAPGPSNSESWRTVQAEHLETIVEKLVKPLTERLEIQAVALAEKDRLIEDQNRQLRLLPDLEKRAEAERKQAELVSLEAEALRKQIEALKGKLEEKIDPEVEKRLLAEKAEKEEALAILRKELDTERTQKEAELRVLKEQLSALQDYRSIAEESQRRIDELHVAMDEQRRQEKEATAEELRRIQEEKTQESEAIKAQLAEISIRLEQSQKPWWKRVFGG